MALFVGCARAMGQLKKYRLALNRPSTNSASLQRKNQEEIKWNSN